jgi:hypothetical protein
MNLKRNRTRGGYVGLMALLVVVAIGLFLYFGRSGGKSYTETVIEKRDVTKETVSRIDLTNLYRDLKIQAMMRDGEYPPDEETLLEDSGIAAELQSKARNAGGAFHYVGGQNESSPATNVLAYVTGPDDESAVLVLYANGSVGELSAFELENALKGSR